jgi:hypothetical protein
MKVYFLYPFNSHKTAYTVRYAALTHPTIGNNW